MNELIEELEKMVREAKREASECEAGDQQIAYMLKATAYQDCLILAMCHE